MLYYLLGTTVVTSAVTAAIYYCTKPAQPRPAIKTTATSSLGSQPSWPSNAPAVVRSSNSNNASVTKYKFSSHIPEHLKKTDEQLLDLYRQGLVLNITDTERQIIDRYKAHLERVNPEEHINFVSDRNNNRYRLWGACFLQGFANPATPASPAAVDKYEHSDPIPHDIKSKPGALIRLYREGLVLNLNTTDRAIVQDYKKTLSHDELSKFEADRAQNIKIIWNVRRATVASNESTSVSTTSSRFIPTGAVDALTGARANSTSHTR